MKKNTSKSGQSIIEVVIAAALISMGVIAALSLTNQTQKNSTYAKTLDLATSYNNQLADYIRDQKNTLGYAAISQKFENDASGNLVTYCMSNLPLTSDEFLSLSQGTCDPDTNLIYNTNLWRELAIDSSNLSSGIIPIIITTSWSDKTVHSATLSFEISQWN